MEVDAKLQGTSSKASVKLDSLSIRTVSCQLKWQGPDTYWTNYQL